MKNSKFLPFLLILIISAAGAAYAESFQLNLVKRIYSIGTATVNGSYFPIGNAISKALNEKLKNKTFIVESTSGSLANVGYMKAGQIDLALIQSDVAYNCYFTPKADRFRELRILSSLYSEIIQIFAKKDSGIKTLTDLREKRIAVGEKDSGSASCVNDILAAAGITEKDYTPVYESFEKSTELLEDGYIDAVFYAGGIPASGIKSLASRVPLIFISFPSEIREKLVKEKPYFSKENLFAYSYNGHKSDCPTIGFRALLACTTDLSEETAVEILKVIYRSGPKISQSNPGCNIHFRDALKGVMPEMLHPGAKAYFTRQGVTIP